MAIRPISQIMPNQTNVIQFEGKKKEKNTPQPHTTPMVKAVPLAVLIAMSPLSSDAASNYRIEPEANTIELVDVPEVNEIDEAQQSGRVLASKTFGKVRASKNLEIQLVQQNNKKNVQFLYTGYDNKITKTRKNQLVKYNFSLRSDDGTSKKFTIKNVHSYTDKELQKDFNSRMAPIPIVPNDKRVTSYMETLNKQYPGAVEVVQYNRVVGPSATGYLENNAGGNSMKTATPKASYGKNIGSNDFDGDNGKYTIRYYSTDGNENNAEVVTVQKAGYPELKVSLAVYHKDTFFSDYNNATQLNYGQVILVDAKNKKYNIVDNALTQAMDFVKQSLTEQGNAFNNAYAVLSLANNYGVTTKGAVFAQD